MSVVWKDSSKAIISVNIQPMKIGGNPQNLTPFPKGVSGNPKGKPKGSRNKMKIFEEMLNAKNGKIGDKRVSNWEMICFNAIKKAKEGDWKAIQDLLDRRLGRPVQKNVNTNVDIKQILDLLQPPE